MGTRGLLELLLVLLDVRGGASLDARLGLEKGQRASDVALVHLRLRRLRLRLDRVRIPAALDNCSR